MSYVIWMVAWFAVQRLMMMLGIVQTNDLIGTLFLTLIGFAACYISATNCLVIFYIIWVIAWGVGHIVHGGLLGVIPGLLVIAFHIGLLVLMVNKRNPTVTVSDNASQRTRQRRRRHGRTR